MIPCSTSIHLYTCLVLCMLLSSYDIEYAEEEEEEEEPVDMEEELFRACMASLGWD